MSRRSYLRQSGGTTLATGLVFMLAATICPVLAKQPQEQQSSQQQQTSQSPPAQLGAETPPNSQPGQPEPKKKKVWTNDEVVSLRTPADNYQIQKEAQEAAVAQAAAKEAAEANLPKEAEPTIKLPSTIEETQQLIKNKEEQINDEQNGLERLIKELPDAPEDQKPAMQREIDRVAMDVPKVRNELKLLQNHLEKLTSAQLNEASVSPPASPPL